ncbi:MAG: hypothetical protein AAGA93_17805 [Actinomycetota bacterium]
MTDRFDGTTSDGNPTDPALSDEFQDEVRRMLHRRAADVSTVRADGSSIRPGGGAAAADGSLLGGPRSDHRPMGQVVDLPERELGLRTTGSVRRGLPENRREVPLTRRFGLVAAAAAVVVIAAVGLMSWRNQAQSVTVGSAAPAGGLLLLPTEDDEVELTGLRVTPAVELNSRGDVLLGYGPTETMIADGLIVLIETVEDPSFASFGDEDEVVVTADRDPLLAERGAVIGPQGVMWVEPGDETMPDRSVTMLTYGEALGDDELLTVAGRVATDVDRVLDADDLLDEWALRVRLDDTTVVSDTVDARLTGAFDGWMTSGGVALPLGLFGAIDDRDLATIEEIEVRGVPALLSTTTYLDDGAPEQPADQPSVTRLVWNEGGTNHQINGMTTADQVIALAERLVPVDPQTARERGGEGGPTGDEVAATTSMPSTVTTAVPSTTGPDPGDVDPPISMTAPGPGDVDLDDRPTTTGSPPGSTTTGPATTGTGSTTTGPATTGPPSTPPATTIPVVRPNGSFTDNSIVPVPIGDPVLGGTRYEVGVSWSPTFGLCLGIDLNGDLTGGGYPVECEIDPLVGAGGRREVPGVGTIVFAFAADDPALASAELEVGGQRYTATIERLDAFPDFAFLVFPLEGVSVEEVDRRSLPGEIILLDGNGESFGWG